MEGEVFLTLIKLIRRKTLTSWPVLCATVAPVFDPVREALAGVEEVLSKSVVGDEAEVAVVVEVAPAEVLLPKHHADTQVLDRTDQVLVGQQRPPNPCRREIFGMPLFYGVHP